MKKIFQSIYKQASSWRTVARVSGVALCLSLAEQQYRFSCQEEAKINSGLEIKDLNAVGIPSENDVQILSKYSNIADLIVHHRTESECIVILPTCSESSKKLILSSLQRKRQSKSIRVFIFDPPAQQTHLSAKEEKREQEKQKDVGSLLENVEFFGINNYGDLRYFSLQESPNITTKQSNSRFRTSIQRALNFFYPPQIIRENDYTFLVDSIQNMSDEARLVICYIPEQKVYNANLPRISSFDSFRQGRIQNIPSLEKRFLDISYNYIETNTKFILVRSSEIAQSLSIGQDDAGELYEIKKSTKMSNKESNFMFAGKEYLYNKMEWDPNTDTNQFLTDKQIEMKIYEKSTNYVQEFNVETELRSFLVSQKEFGTQKFLVYYSAEVLEQDYEEKIIKKLISVKKNINDSKFCVIFTKNPSLLRKFFGIIPESNTDTVRLFDFSSEPTLKSSTFTNSYIDWSLAKQDSDSSLLIQSENSHMDDSSAFEKEALSAKRYKYEGKITRNKLTMFVKQSMSTQCNSYFILPLDFFSLFKKSNKILNFQEGNVYQESEGTIQSGHSKITYLNSVNFEKEIFQNKHLEYNPLDDSEQDGISLVYFYKPGCPNCTAMNKALEKFSSDLTNIQSDLDQYDNQQRKLEKYDETLLNLYNLKNHTRFKSLKVYRYNIYNECKGFPSPSAAPLVFIFTKNSLFKPIQADLIKDRVNLNDSDKVSRYLFKKVDLLNL